VSQDSRAANIVVLGGMTMDDIVLSDGRVHQRVPGGNALYAALGAALWRVPSEIVSFVGADYPQQVLDGLAARGVSTGNVVRRPGSSIRLWILYEHDGRRQIHLQHDSPTLEPVQELAAVALPGLLSGSPPPAAAHVAALPVRTQRSIAATLRRAGVPFSLDTLEARGSVGGDLDSYLEPGRDMAPDVFLPSRDEFLAVFGGETSSTYRSWVASTRTTTLVIKDGAGGSHVSSPLDAPWLRVPAFPIDVVDPTGAGDAFCGGYVAGMVRRAAPAECAAMGTVSASFVIEQVGVHGLLAATPDQAQRRMNTVLSAVPATGPATEPQD
jgi:sugar/nucleoside kinase (ribokinase family)